MWQYWVSRFGVVCAVRVAADGTAIEASEPLPPEQVIIGDEAYFDTSEANAVYLNANRPRWAVLDATTGEVVA